MPLQFTTRPGQDLITTALTAIMKGTAVAVFALAIFVWPTTYRYDHMNLSGMVLPVRIHRITGKSEVLCTSGWVVAGQMGSKAVELYVPSNEIAKLQGTAEVSGSKLTCKLYNGSTWRIQEIVVHLQVFDSDSKTRLLERDYRLSNNYFTDPLTTGIFDDYIWVDLQRGQRIDWNIKSAKGCATLNFTAPRSTIPWQQLVAAIEDRNSPSSPCDDSRSPLEGPQELSYGSAASRSN